MAYLEGCESSEIFWVQFPPVPAVLRVGTVDGISGVNQRIWLYSAQQGSSKECKPANDVIRSECSGEKWQLYWCGAVRYLQIFGEVVGLEWRACIRCNSRVS